MVLAGFLASFFVARDALNFPILQMAIGVILFTLLVALITFGPTKNWYEHLVLRFKNRKKKAEK